MCATMCRVNPYHYITLQYDIYNVGRHRLEMDIMGIKTSQTIAANKHGTKCFIFNGHAELPYQKKMYGTSMV